MPPNCTFSPRPFENMNGWTVDQISPRWGFPASWFALEYKNTCTPACANVASGAASRRRFFVWRLAPCRRTDRPEIKKRDIFVDCNTAHRFKRLPACHCAQLRRPNGRLSSRELRAANPGCRSGGVQNTKTSHGQSTLDRGNELVLSHVSPFRCNGPAELLASLAVRSSRLRLFPTTWKEGTHAPHVYIPLTQESGHDRWRARHALVLRKWGITRCPVRG